MGDESGDSSTEQRLDRLESVVKQQNETIREMLPGRRAVVAGGAAAALGFGAGAGSASGQSAAGKVGTESEPVDVEAAAVNAGSVNTDIADIDEVLIRDRFDEEGAGTFFIGDLNTSVTGQRATVIGAGAEGQVEDTVIGVSAKSISGNASVIVGEGSRQEGQKNIVVGSEGHILGSDPSENVLVSHGSANSDPSVIRGSANTVVGSKTDVGKTTGTAVSENVVLGTLTRVDRDKSIVIGDGAAATTAGAKSTIIGYEAESSADDGIAVGARTSVTADQGVAIGDNVTVSTGNLARVGAGDTQAAAPQQLAFAAVQDIVPDADLNTSEMTIEMDESAGAFRLRGKDSTGTVREATISW